MDRNITSDECPDDPAVCDCGYHENMRAAERSHQEALCQTCESWQVVDGDRHGMCLKIGRLPNVAAPAYVTGLQAALWTLPTFSCRLWRNK